MPQVFAGQRVTATIQSTSFAAADIGAVTVTQAALTDLTASFTVPGLDPAPGHMYEIEAWGNGTWGSTAQALTFQTVYAGQSMSTVTLGANYMAVSTAFRWRCVIAVVCLTTGVSGTFSSLLHGECSVFGANLLVSGGSSTTATSGFVGCESTATFTVDTTVAQGLKLQANWASTTGAPTLTKRIAIQRKRGVG